MTRTADPYDELAELYLSESEQRGRAASRADVEVVLVGHLPVRGGVWLTPYAHAVAEGHSTSLLIRLDADHPCIEVFQARGQSHEPAPASSFRQALGELTLNAQSLLVRPGNNVTPDDVLSCDADRITILTSADEVASVAAYQIIKQLAEHAREQRRRIPSLGLAVLGSERTDAEDLVQRINDTASNFLGFQVALTRCLPHIGSAVRTSRYHDFPAEPTPELAQVVQWMREPVRPAAPVPPPDDEPKPQQPATRAFPSAQTEPSATTPVETVRKEFKLPPKPTMHIEPKVSPQSPRQPVETVRKPALQSAGLLASHVDGVDALEVRCPKHEQVELGVDRSGRLHLMAREHDLRDIQIVESWAKLHRELITMACRDQWIDQTGQVVCHVFTEEPSRLADLHNTDLRLHVLAPVIVEGNKGWYAAPLNAVAK